MKEEIALTSGRVLTPNCGILGLERRGARWYVTEGYDNLADYDASWNTKYNQLTKREREEVAMLMTRRWMAWADGK